MTRTFSAPLGSGVQPLALIAVIAPPGVSVICAAGKVDVGSFAATLITSLPEAGSPVMYAFEPSLPEEATTMTPSCAAFSAATASGESGLPNGEPSDMLITSMLLSTAHSIASMTSFVGPLQPKIFTE